MSSPWTAKRRKLNESSGALTKPFVSPLRKDNAKGRTLEASNNAGNLPYQPSTFAHTVKAVSPVIPRFTTPKNSVTTPAKSVPVRKQPTFNDSKRTTDPAELAALKALTSLELQIRSIRNEIDTLKQAQQIRSTTTDADLEDLAQKWKSASQCAAEELFGTVKERVCRMGGVAAWRESEKKKYERSNGLGEFAQEEEEADDDADCEFDSQGEELPEEEQEWRKREKARVRKEMRDAMEVEAGSEKVPEDRIGGKMEVWQEPGGDDDVSTLVVTRVESHD